MRVGSARQQHHVATQRVARTVSHPPPRSWSEGSSATVKLLPHQPGNNYLGGKIAAFDSLSLFVVWPAVGPHGGRWGPSGALHRRDPAAHSAAAAVDPMASRVATHLWAPPDQIIRSESAPIIWIGSARIFRTPLPRGALLCRAGLCYPTRLSVLQFRVQSVVPAPYAAPKLRQSPRRLGPSAQCTGKGNYCVTFGIRPTIPEKCLTFI